MSREAAEPYQDTAIAILLHPSDRPARDRRETAMTHAQDVMTPAQMAALVDAAFAVRHPLTYLDTTMSTFRAVGRDADAHAVALIGCLYAEGEIELLMRLKAAWKQGQVRDPESIIRPETRWQR